MNGSDEILFFEICFHPAASLYYEIDDMWEETLKEKYDLSELEKQSCARGIYQVKGFDSPKMKQFDPKGSLNFVKFLVLSQYCFCEVIAKENVEIKQYHRQFHLNGCYRPPLYLGLNCPRHQDVQAYFDAAEE